MTFSSSKFNDAPSEITTLKSFNIASAFDITCMVPEIEGETLICRNEIL